jgi:glycosyltransferase involved in cell wall biosynthesis
LGRLSVVLNVTLMRLCVVTGTFHPEPGGPSTFLYNLLPQLQTRGYEVEVITYGEPEMPKDYPYQVTRISRRQPIPLRVLALAQAVLRAGRRADAFFVSDYGLPVALANLLLGKPILLKNVGDFAWEFSTRHGWIPTGQTIDEFQTAPHSLRINLLRAVQRWYTRAATTVVAPSHYSASLVLGWGIPAGKVKVIHNALDPVKEGQADSSLQPPIQFQHPTLLAVARLTPWKGLAGIIRALARVRATLPNAQLVVVGDGPERKALEAEAAPLGQAVIFLGTQPPERVHHYLKRADLFILFSTYEGLPHTVIEAMQAGTPVIVSNAGGNTEVVTHNQTGWVVPKGDEAALAAAIIEAINDPALGQQYALAATASLVRFSWPRLVNDYDAALRSLIEQ